MCIYLTIIKIKDGRMAHFPTELKQCRKFPQRGDIFFYFYSYGRFIGITPMSF